LILFFLGSSHSYRGFDTRIFKKSNFKTFNLGTSSQTLIQSEYLFNKYVLKINPKILVLEINPLIFSLDGLESSLDLINSNIVDSELFKIGIKHRNAKAINSIIFSSLCRVLLPKKKNILKWQDDKYIKGGYVEKKMAFLKVYKIKNQILKVNKNQSLAFNRFLMKISKTHIKLILVQAPISRVLYDSYKGNYKFDSLMKTKGMYYNFNYCNGLNLIDTLHFYDMDHMNQEGVNIFNKYFIKSLFKS